MKIKINLSDYFDYVGIKYQEDMYADGNIYYEYEKYSIDDIMHNLPPEIKITEEQLKEYSGLRRTLENALNSNSENGLMSACVNTQDKMVENTADDVVKYINQIETSTGKKLKAIKTITIDWKTESAIIDVNIQDALSATREIINGEGMFEYESNEALARVCDGKNNPTQAIKHHIHYLLNLKLIDSIYGFSGRPNFNWEVSSWDSDKMTVLENIANNATVLEYTTLTGKTHIALYAALTAHEKIKEMESKLIALRTKTGLLRQSIPKKQLKLYEQVVYGKAS